MGRLSRLPSYDYNQEGYYFLTFCTRGRAHILADETPNVGRDDLGAPTAPLSLTPLGQILDGYIRTISTAYPSVSLHHFAIMPNHVHLLISVHTPDVVGAPRSSRPTQLIPRIIAALKRFTNQAAGVDLWQTTYHDHIIRDEPDYLRIWNYIDTNPAKWAEDCYFSLE